MSDPRPARGELPALSVAVMAHPSRAELVEGLRKRLRRPLIDVEWDVDGDEWDTARRALLARDPDADYHLVIQDDALPCADLLAGTVRALAAVPDGAVLSLYSGASARKGTIGRAIRGEAETLAPFVVASRLWWGVAVCYPTRLIDDLVAGAARIAVREYDRRVSSWLRRKGVPVVYTCPSLVDHRDVPSLLHHDRPDGPRRAAWFAGENTSALDLPWDGAPIVVSDPRAPAQQERRASRAPVVQRR